MRKTLLIVLALVLAFTTILSACNGDDSSQPSTAPTDGMDFSFDKNDVDGSYDESEVISVIQGDPVSIPEDSSEEISKENTSTEDVFVNDSSLFDDSSATVTEDTSSKSEDNSSKPEDTSSKVEDASSKAEDTSSKTEDTSSKVEDTSSKVEDTSSKVEDTSSKTEDNSSKVEDTSSKVEDTSSVAPAPAPEGDVYIKTAGVHKLTGGFTDRMIIVEVGVNDKVQLVLSGVVINNTKGPAIYVKEADKVTITADAGTANYVSDGSVYTYNDGSTSVDGAIFSLGDLTVKGPGKLTVKGNTKHGIVSKDNLVISGCVLDVTSKLTALVGKDCVKVKDGNIKLAAGSNGIVSDNIEDKTRGYIYFEGGTVNVTAGYDGIQAETIINSNNTAITVKAGGGSGTMLNNASQSFKAMKAGSDILISGGTYNLDSRDDCLHSNNTVNITGGALTLSSGDDAIRAGADLAVSGGDVSITKSNEGIEAARVLISGGSVSVVSYDDSLNAETAINISGGYLFVNSDSDGIDSKGNITVSGGVILINSSKDGYDSMEGVNCMLEFDGTATVTGGVVVALGTSAMPLNFSQAQNQGSIFVRFAVQDEGTTFAVCDSTDKVIASFTAPKAYQSAIITAPDIQSGNTYTLVAGATVAGADANGFAQNTTKTGGTTLTTVTMTSNLYYGM